MSTSTICEFRIIDSIENIISLLDTIVIQRDAFIRNLESSLASPLEEELCEAFNLCFQNK